MALPTGEHPDGPLHRVAALDVGLNIETNALDAGLVFETMESNEERPAAGRRRRRRVGLDYDGR